MSDAQDKFRKYDADLLKYIDHIFGSNPDSNVFKKYIYHLQAESDVSPRTQELYVKDLFGTYDLDTGFIRSADYTFLSFLPIQKIRAKNQINRETIRNYIAWLVENGIANSSVNRRLSALRSFYQFLLQEEMVTESPIPVRTHQRNSPRSNLSMKMAKKLPVFLTGKEIEQLIRTPDLTKPEGRRDRAMLELLYASGLRVSELWQLNLESLDLNNREIRVIGKGSKERVVLIGIPAVKAVEEYIQYGRPALLNNQTTGALFLNHQGKRLSIRGIQILLKHYSSAIGLEKNVHSG